MPPFDRTTLDPAPEEVTGAIETAVRQVNYRCRVGKLQPKPEEFAACAARVAAEPEGVRYWAAGRRSIATVAPNDLLSLVGVAWWSDHMGRKHVRVAGRRLQRNDEFHQNCFGPRDEPWPAVCLIHPERLFIRRPPGGEPEVIAACRCGVVGPIGRMAWMGPECGPCFDQRQEKPDREPSAGRPLTLRGHRGPVTGVAFGSGGAALVSAGFGRGDDLWGGTIRFVDLPGGTCRREAEVDAYMGTDRVRIACDGARVAAAEYRGVLTLDVNGRKRPARDAGLDYVEDVALSPDGAIAAITGGEVHLRRAGGGAEWEGVSSGRRGPTSACSLCFSPDGRTLAYGLSQGALAVMDLGARRVRTLRDRRVRNPAVSLAFFPDGERLIAGGGGFEEGEFGLVWSVKEVCQVVVWDLRSGTLAARPAEHRGAVYAVAASPDGTTGVSAGRDRRVRFWDARSYEPLGELEWHAGTIYALAFSPDGEWLATGSGDGLVRLWPWRRLLGA